MRCLRPLTLLGAAVATTLVMGLAAACNGGTAAPSPDSNDGAPPGADGAAPDIGVTPLPDTGVSCPPASADAGIVGPRNPASGTLIGPDVNATICNAGATVFTEQYVTSPAMTYLQLSYGDITFTEPSGAVGMFLLGDGQIGAPAPGTYTSTGSSCGSLGVAFTLPLPPGTDCGDGSIVGPSCPANCSSACSGFGCLPCTPNPPEGNYAAQGGGDCFGVAQPAAGSWTITLTQVQQYAWPDGGASQGRTDYVVHGSVVAQVLGGAGDASNLPATLTLTF